MTRAGCTHDCVQGRYCTCDALMAGVNMEQVTRAALGLRRWWLEFDCAGSPLVWKGEAANESAAESRARNELAADHPELTPASRLVACLEQS